jgi:hypothetical protein
LAFGLRASLFERFCPLPILPNFNRVVFPHLARQTYCARIEVGFQTIEQTRPGGPRLGAAFEPGTDMTVGGLRCAFTIRRCESTAPVG